MLIAKSSKWQVHLFSEWALFWDLSKKARAVGFQVMFPRHLLPEGSYWLISSQFSIYIYVYVCICNIK